MDTKERNRRNMEYKGKNVDRINFEVPKGEKEKLQAIAAARGESLNAYIRRAIMRQVEEDTRSAESYRNATRDNKQ